MNRLILGSIFIFFFIPRLSTGETFFLPGTDSVVGQVEYVEARRDDTLMDVARRYGLGYDEIIAANPGVNRWIPGEGTRVKLPRSFILPDAPREGIVINLGELRLYYFSAKGAEGQFVYTYPISIGRMDWKSPLGRTRVVSKEKNPAWRPPPSIREEAILEGEVLPEVVPGGVPENPLGSRAIRLGIPQYLIHGTDEKKEFGIGMRVTHGCVRMYPEDIERLYDMVSVGTPVMFVDQPIKAGWRGDTLAVEIHAPLREDSEEYLEYSHRVELQEAISVIEKVADVELDYQRLRELISRADGVPTPIGREESGLLPPARR